MIECANLCKTYVIRERSSWFSRGVRREITALRGVSMAVSAGEKVALLGPNGAGKTTLLKILSTLLLPDSGKCLIAGYDVVKSPQQVRRQIGLVLPSDRSLYWKLTALENLSLYGGLYDLPAGIVKERSRILLEQVGLLEFAHVQVEKFSTGMRKRLMIARALLHQPRLLILDEPTSGLDVQGKREVWALLKDLSATHSVTLLLATHDMEEAEYLPDRLLIIHQGRVYADGSPAEIKTLAGHETRLLIDLPEPMSQEIHLPGIHLEKIENRDGLFRLTIKISRPETDIPHILRLFPQCIRFERCEAGLGDAFLALTGDSLEEEPIVDSKE